VRQIGLPAFRERAPYAVAWIDMDEGFRMISNVTGVDDPTKDIHIGQRVRVSWDDQPPAEGEVQGFALPLFEPVA
jgi:uncharacterized OB-fold protein